MRAVPKELTPGVLSATFTRLAERTAIRGATVVTRIGLAVERQAKANAGAWSHRLGTPTPAQHGSGPARISGTLVRSLTHTQASYSVGGWEVRVGTAAGFYPPYGKGRTPSSRYGYYLEHDHNFPFLEPAWRFGCNIIAPVVLAETYGAGAWSRLI